MKVEQLHSCAASSRDPVIGATVFLCQWSKKRERDVLETEIPVAACLMAPDGESMCVLWGKTGRKTQVEVREISLCRIRIWEIAATPSFL